MKEKPRYHEHRAARAEAALEAYRKAIGENGPHDRDRLRDLMQDILHWIAKHDTALENNPCELEDDILRDCCETAINDFPAELEEEVEEESQTT